MADVTPDDEEYERSTALAGRRIGDYDHDPAAEELAASRTLADRLEQLRGAAPAVDQVPDPALEAAHQSLTRKEGTDR